MLRESKIYFFACALCVCVHWANPKKTWCLGPCAGVDYYLPFVHVRVDSNTFTMGNTMPESTLTLCRSRLYSPELVVLVDFKAIYPGVPPGIFASFPGVAHFLSFEQICQYPRVRRKSTGYPGVLFPRGRPRGNQNTLG